jgi:hypothetical protein
VRVEFDATGGRLRELREVRAMTVLARVGLVGDAALSRGVADGVARELRVLASEE